MDLTGKLIIKARLGDDIRRIPIHNEDLTYDELILMMQRVFKGTLSNDDDIVVKYADEDGDLITLFDDSDITLAIQMSRKLKLTLSVNKPTTDTKDEGGIKPENVLSFKKELVSIRNRINAILDTIEVPPTDTADVKYDGDTQKQTSSQPQVNLNDAASLTNVSDHSKSISDASFDPLNQGGLDMSQKQSRPSSTQATPPHFSAPATPTTQPTMTSTYQNQTAIDSSFGITTTSSLANGTHQQAPQTAGTGQGMFNQPNIQQTQQRQAPQSYQQTTQPPTPTMAPNPYGATTQTAPKQEPPKPLTGFPNQQQYSSQMQQGMKNPSQQNAAAAQQPPTMGYGMPNQLTSYGSPSSATSYPGQSQQSQPTAQYPPSTQSQSSFPQTPSSQPQSAFPPSSQPQSAFPPAPSSQPQQGYQQPGYPQQSPGGMQGQAPTSQQQYAQGPQQSANQAFPPAGNYYGRAPVPSQGPPPGGNPHRIMRGGSYRPRQPGPGYQ